MLLSARLVLRQLRGDHQRQGLTYVDHGGLRSDCFRLRIDCYRHRSGAGQTLSASKFAHFSIAIFCGSLAGLASVRAVDRTQASGRFKTFKEKLVTNVRTFTPGGGHARRVSVCLVSIGGQPNKSRRTP